MDLLSAVLMLLLFVFTPRPTPILTIDLTTITTQDSPLYVVAAHIEGYRIDMLVDTGASITILSEQDMARIRNKRPLGLGIAILADERKIQTRVYQIQHLYVAGCRLDDVIAGTGPARLGIIGMQVLTQLEPFAIGDGKLTFTCHKK